MLSTEEKELYLYILRENQKTNQYNLKKLVADVV